MTACRETTAVAVDEATFERICRKMEQVTGISPRPGSARWILRSWVDLWCASGTNWWI